MADRLGHLGPAQRHRPPGSPRRAPRLAVAVEVEQPGARAGRGCRSVPRAAPTARTALPPRGWRWKPWPIHSSDGPLARSRRAASSISGGRNPGRAPAPRGRARLEQRLELLEADRRARSSSSRSQQPVAVRVRAQQREGERGVAIRGTAARCRSAAAAVGVRTGSTTITAPASLRRASARAGGALTPTGSAPQTRIARRVARRARVEAVERRCRYR